MSHPRNKMELGRAGPRSRINGWTKMDLTQRCCSSGLVTSRPVFATLRLAVPNPGT
jgi:hypothetical protein